MRADRGSQAHDRANTVHHLLDIAAPPETVFSAVTTTEGLSRWWTTGVSAGERGDGQQFRFTFRGPFNPVMRVTELEPPARVQWQGVGDHDAWGSPTTISFTLDVTGSGTSVEFRHVLGHEINEKALASANFNWGYYLDSLRMLCETGTGKPFRPDNPDARVAASDIG